jgi:hypothetical protein
VEKKAKVGRKEVREEEVEEWRFRWGGVSEAERRTLTEKRGTSSVEAGVSEGKKDWGWGTDRRLCLGRLKPVLILNAWRSWAVIAKVFHPGFETSNVTKEPTESGRRKEQLVVDELLNLRSDRDRFHESDLVAVLVRERFNVLHNVVGVERAEEDARDGGKR